MARRTRLLLPWAGLMLSAMACAEGPAAAAVSVVGERAVTLSVEGLDPVSCCGPASGIVVEPRDGGAVGRIPVELVGLDRQVADLPASPRAATVVTRVHLWLGRPLQARRSYRITIGAAGIVADAVFDPVARSPAIAVNQLGYAPGARKVALVGHWLGSAGPMPVKAAGFTLVDDGGQQVWRGPLVLREARDPWSGNEVHVADFSAFDRPGRYRVSIEGIGVSDEFAIADDVYEPAYRSVMRVFYHQRNSTPIEARFAAPGYARGGGVPAALDAVYDGNVGTSPLGNGERPGAFRAIHGGWFDAGDYGQYVPNAAPVWFYVALGLDLAPGNFADGDLGIPESGNGLPDVLDELEWGLDWLLSMQDARDGGVYFRVASERWDDGLPQQVHRPRLIAQKTTHATATFAAAAAIHARLIARDRPQRARQALAAAESAWNFLAGHPQWPAEGERYRNRAGMHAGEYSDASAQDNRLWAAAELLRVTGDDRYLEYFESRFPSLKLDPTGEVSYADQGMAAAWAYLQWDDPRRDPQVVAVARRALLAGADWRIRQMQANPWLAPSHPRRSLTGWGNFAHSARAALTLMQAYHLTGDRRYLEWAWVTPGVQLGINPQGMSYVTGLGARSPRHPLSKLSQYSGTRDPLPGLPVHGPHARLPGTWPTTRLVTGSYWPAAVDDGLAADGGDGYPVLRRYTDSDQLPPMSEPTVAEIARVGMAFGLLRRGIAVSRGIPQQ
jgi:hypothetical protein